MARWVYHYYRCTNYPKCKTTDRDTRLEEDSSTPLNAVPCQGCGSGRGLSEDQLMVQGKGMRRLATPPEGCYPNSWEENAAYSAKKLKEESTKAAPVSLSVD